MSIPLSRGWTLRGAALDGRALLGTTVALCLSVTGTLAGPCTAQIAELEQRVSPAPTNPQNTPSAPQSVAAQLHRQPGQAAGRVPAFDEVAQLDEEIAAVYVDAHPSTTRP